MLDPAPPSPLASPELRCPLGDDYSDMTTSSRDETLHINEASEETRASGFFSCMKNRAIFSIHQGVDHTADQWKILLFGQVLSFLFASQGAAQSTLHLQCSLSAPAFATGLVYVILTIHLIPIIWKGRQLREKELNGSLLKEEPAVTHWFLRVIPLQGSPFIYLGVALLDVEANYFTVMAYRYTYLTSVSVLDAVAIPSAMIFSRLCLRRRYVSAHLIGVAVCLCGMSTNVFADYESEGMDDESYPYSAMGDFLAILGGLMFGARDVLTELSVKNFGGTDEYLGMVGLFGTLISFIQVMLTERQNVEDFFGGSTETCSQTMGVWLLLAYVTTTSLRYVGFAHFLVVSEAALLNLSLLTTDLWSAIFEIEVTRIVPNALFWLALVLVLGGVFIYESGPSPIVEDGNEPHVHDEREVKDVETPQAPQK